MPKNLKKPYLHFYPSDHKSDPGIVELDYASEYVWLKMLHLMSECEDRGRLAVKGKPISLPSLSRECKMPVHQLKGCIKNILDKGVGSRGPDGVIFSRRMVRDEQYRKKAAKFGKQGGNPTLKTESKSAASKGIKPSNMDATTGKVAWNGTYWFPDRLEKVLAEKIAEVERLEKQALKSQLHITNIRRDKQSPTPPSPSVLLLKEQISQIQDKLYGYVPAPKPSKPAGRQTELSIDPADSSLLTHRADLVLAIQEIETPADEFRSAYYSGKKLKPKWRKALENHKINLADTEAQIERRGLAKKEEVVA